MELWDAYYRDGTPAGRDLVRWEPVPEGLYHIVCDVLVRHRDGDYLLMERSREKVYYGGWWEASAGGCALKGEDGLACARRELREETGIASGDFQLFSRVLSEENHCIFLSWLCRTDWSKDAITLQPGETSAWRWVAEEEFLRFLRSDQMIPPQRERYLAHADTFHSLSR